MMNLKNGNSMLQNRMNLDVQNSEFKEYKYIKWLVYFTLTSFCVSTNVLPILYQHVSGNDTCSKLIYNQRVNVRNVKSSSILSQTKLKVKFIRYTLS